MLTLHDSRTGSEARILPELGFNCYQFSAIVGERRVEVLDAEPGFDASAARPSANGIPLLFPFPNRIAQGRFQWDGKEYTLPINKPPNAIHGFVFDKPWKLNDADDVTATAEFQLSREAPDRLHLWPADFVLTVTYALRGNALFSEIVVRNPGRKPLPWGFGTHTYFRYPLAEGSTASECLIQVPAKSTWELVDSLPTGRRHSVTSADDLRDGREIEGLKLDSVYTDLEVVDESVQTVLMDARAGIEVIQSFDAGFREVVAFTPPHGRSICMEPYTCTSNALLLQQQGVDSGWKVLAPGETARMWIAIEVGPVLV